MTSMLEDKKQQKLDTARLKKVAQAARRLLKEQVETKLDYVLLDGSSASRSNPKAVSDLKDALTKEPKKELIERISYIWFNRFCALRFMDLNGYTKIRVVSPLEGQVQPEILAEAKGGFIDEELVTNKQTREKITGLLNGSINSNDAQSEAYSLLLVSVCNYYHNTMPYLFERIDDYTELLMPDDLLSGNSILAYTREALVTGTCKDEQEEPIVEVIGWLYQYYISERKEQVFAALKKNKKIESSDIPAATQLFTPNWIVRYLVENSLGRLWMLNKPNSKLKEQMPYYIASTQEEDYLKINSPEEIKVCDPACGSGHMLVYAFDLLYEIYEEEGYEPNEIPTKILQNNLYGIEIDERAGELAAFALTMKARAKHKRFFSKPVQPNICVLENIDLSENDLSAYMDKVGRDLFTAPLLECLRQFKEAKNFGALIRPVVHDVKYVLEILEKKNVSQNLLLYKTHDRVLEALKQADYLSQKYHVVVANPPYMGGKGMNGSLSNFAKKDYPDSKSDTFAMFIERGLELIIERGFSATVTMESWMFLSSFEKLRKNILDLVSIQSMVHMPYLGKGGTSMGISFGTSAFVLHKLKNPTYEGRFCCLRHYETDERGVPLQFPPKNERLSHASAADFKKIPGSPIAYWASKGIFNAFEKFPSLEDIGLVRQGASTSDNTQFLRLWYEVTYRKIGFKIKSLEQAINSNAKWFPYNKGGEFRKWYGNQDYVINYEKDGSELKEFQSTLNQGWTVRLKSREYYFKPSVSWSKISTKSFSARLYPIGFVFDVAGCCYYPYKESASQGVVSFLNSSVSNSFLKLLSPTLNFEIEHIKRLPYPENINFSNHDIYVASSLSQNDWDSYETSWDFKALPLISTKELNKSLKETYTKLRSEWQSMTDETKGLEEENNKIFIEAYGLEDELTPEVPLKEITLTCNPYYRYGDKKSLEQLESLLEADTMREFISYAVGCIFGRYSLDKLGLILANQGETIEDYLKQIPQPSFKPDDDNIIPVLDGNWFTDDIAERFRNFLKVSFGEEHYEENLVYIESAIGKDIRKYFIKDFYNDHIKRYKKRPIYWMFSSAKGSFNALVYMHRYRADTVSTILNGYLREYRSKLSNKINQLEAVETSKDSSQAAQTKALKDVEAMRKVIKELIEYEQEVLYPLATQKVEIDLDDGVSINYNKLGKALQKVAGLSE